MREDSRWKKVWRMCTFEELLDKKAENFRLGNVDQVADSLVTPTGLYVDGTFLAVLNPHHNIRILEQYRARLLELGYLNTVYDILEREQLCAEFPKIKVTVNWRHLNRNGGMIASLRVLHYCSKIDGVWCEEMAEICMENSNLVTDYLHNALEVATRR